MTCPYFSIKDGKPFCQLYNIKNASFGKIEECHSDYGSCVRTALERWDESTVESTESRAIRKIEIPSLKNVCSSFEPRDIMDSY